MKAGIPINAANMTLLEDLQSSGPKLIGFVRFLVEVEGGYNRARFYFNHLAKNTALMTWLRLVNERMRPVTVYIQRQNRVLPLLF